MTLICLSIFGIGGYSGLGATNGLLLLGLNIGAIFLADRQIKRGALNPS